MLFNQFTCHITLARFVPLSGIYERNNMSYLKPQSDLPASLLTVLHAGFSLAHLPLFAFSAPWPPRPIDPAEPLPVLEEVTERALRHDLKAIEYRHVRRATWVPEGTKRRSDSVTGSRCFRISGTSAVHFPMPTHPRW